MPPSLPPCPSLLLADQFQSVSDMLRWRSQSQGETVLYSLMDAKVGGSGGRGSVGDPQLTVLLPLVLAVVCACVWSSGLCLPLPLHQGHVAQKLTAAVLHKRAERLAYVVKERFKPAHGEHMALLYTPSEWRVDHTQWAHTPTHARAGPLKLSWSCWCSQQAEGD